MVKKITKIEFLNQCYEKYQDKYSYDYMNFIDMRTKIKLKCNSCNEFFYKTPNHFLRRGQGCKKCRVIKRKNKKNIINFIKKSVIIHGNKYNYDEVKKNYNSKKVKIFCNTCGVFFYQRPSSHISGCGHLNCCNKKEQNIFIEQIKNIHGNKYKYDKVEYIKNNIHISIYCNIHKYYFKQLPSHHIKGHGCPKCSLSSGEKKIIKYFNENNIKYKTQKYHYFLSKKIYYDFFLPEYNLYIEYDGRQHFTETSFFRNNLIENIHNDLFKNAYICHINKKLLRISYLEKNNIDEILKLYINNDNHNNIYYSNKKLYNTTYDIINNATHLVAGNSLEP